MGGTWCGGGARLVVFLLVFDPKGRLKHARAIVEWVESLARKELELAPAAQPHPNRLGLEQPATARI